MSAGLSRRRTAASAAATAGGAVVTSGASGNAGPSTDTASTSPKEKDSKRIVVCDERDVVDTSDNAPKLTLLEEVFLLGLKDKQGYLSFWNDNISYALRGCILIELALRHRIGIIQEPARRRLALCDRNIQVLDDKPTGEVLLDEALRLMKLTDEKMSAKTWIDLMSGETWNVMKMAFQLKQVRERVAKGLVDKGILRTEKKNFFLFDMATHPIEDNTSKRELIARCFALLLSKTTAIPEIPGLEHVRYPVTRAICLVCSAASAAVLDNAISSLSFDAKDEAKERAEGILNTFAIWPLGGGVTADAPQVIGEGSKAVKFNPAEIVRLVRQEMSPGTEQYFELITAVMSVFETMDTLG